MIVLEMKCPQLSKPGATVKTVSITHMRRGTLVNAPGSGMITELGALSSDSTPNTHNPLLSSLYASANSWNSILIAS